MSVRLDMENLHQFMDLLETQGISAEDLVSAGMDEEKKALLDNVENSAAALELMVNTIGEHVEGKTGELNRLRLGALEPAELEVRQLERVEQGVREENHHFEQDIAAMQKEIAALERYQEGLFSLLANLGEELKKNPEPAYCSILRQASTCLLQQRSGVRPPPQLAAKKGV